MAIKIITSGFDAKDGGIQALSDTIRSIFEESEWSDNIGKVKILMDIKYRFKLFGWKYVLYMHGLEFLPEKKLQKYVLKLILYMNRPAKIVFVSNLTKEIAIQNYPWLKAVDSAVIYNPVNMKIQEARLKEKIILTVCRAVPRKNLESAFQAFRELKLVEKGWRYIYIGTGPLKDELKSKFPEIEMLGATPDKERNDYLKMSTIFLHPQIKIGNDFEGFGLAPVEAIYNQCIPLIGENCGLAELIEDESLKTTGSIADIKAKLFDILKTIDDGEEIDVNSLAEKLNAKLSWATYSKEMEAFLEN